MPRIIPVAQIPGLQARLEHYRRVTGSTEPAANTVDEIPLTRVGIRQSDDGSQTILRISGPMDWWSGFEVPPLLRALDRLAPTNLLLLIDSPGGDLDPAISLYSDLRARVNDGMTLSAEARGTVASAATLPFIAADTRLMGEGSSLMVHAPLALFIAHGNLVDAERHFAQFRAAMTSYTEVVKRMYADRVGEQIVSEGWEAEDRWYSANKAIEVGLATGQATQGQPSQAKMTSQYSNIQGLAPGRPAEPTTVAPPAQTFHHAFAQCWAEAQSK